MRRGSRRLAGCGGGLGHHGTKYKAVLLFYWSAWDWAGAKALGAARGRAQAAGARRDAPGKPALLAPEPLRLTSSSIAGVRNGFTMRLSAAIVRENRIVLVSRSQGPQMTWGSVRAQVRPDAQAHLF